MSTQTMQAVMQSAYGEVKDVLKVTAVPIPAFDTSSQDLLIRVKAVSVNPLDWLLVQGQLKIVFIDKMPSATGADLSGVVARAGRGTGFKEGDEVYGFMQMHVRGSMAEYCVVPAQNCALKPKSLSHEEAACLPIAGLTALQALQRHSGPKGTAFISAGLGGVGSIALQLAKPFAGFKYTITTASTAKVALVKEHIKDIDEVIDYKKVDPGTVIPMHSCDFVLDQFGKPSQYVQYIKKPASGSRDGKPSIISILALPSAKKLQSGLGLKVGLFMRIGLDVMDTSTRLFIPGWINYDSFYTVPSPSGLKIMADLADQGKLKPVIHKVFPLAQAVEAIMLAETKPAGKVVIRISD